MNYLLPFIISGIATGSIYGLTATGLVLTYKTSGIFNFGHGAIATVAAYFFYWMHVSHNIDWKLSFVVAVLVLGPLMGFGMEGLSRQLSRQRLVYKVVGSVGLIVLVQALATLKYGFSTKPFPSFIPGGDKTFGLWGARVGYDDVVITAVSVLAVAALFVFFRFSRTGTAMRAVVDDPDLLDLQGTNPVRVRRLAWIAGCTLAAMSGVLVAPLIGLDSVLLTFLVVQAFGAAAIGAFVNIPLTFVGGVALGIGADVSQKYVVNLTWLTGLPASLPFIVLIVVLLVLPRRKLAPPTTAVKSPREPYKAPPVIRLAFGLVVLAALAFVPSFAGDKLSYYSLALVTAIVILSLGLLVRTSGQVSLCHACFMAIGACAFSQFAGDLHLNWFVAVLLGALVAVPVGACVAIPSVRLSGLFLALATFGFGVMVQQLIYPLSFMFGLLQSGRAMPRPSFAASDHDFYYVILGFLVATVLVIVAIHGGRLGRLLRGLSESPVAVSTLGLSVTVTRVTVFCISAFIAALGGILYGQVVHFASSDDAQYASMNSLVLVAMLIVAPLREPWYALPAGIGAVVPAYWTSEDSTYWLNALFGFFAIVISVQGGHVVMPAAWRTAITNRFTLRPATRAHRARSTDRVVSVPRTTSESIGLQVEDLTVRFGGLVAVSELSMTVPGRQVTGLIGPNGAGKTTTFNACSGLNRPTHGSVHLNGVDVSRMSPAARARHGLGRTFQRMELCDGLTVAENVSLGCESSQGGGRFLSQLVASRPQHRHMTQAVDDALRICHIEHIADQPVGDLSTGQRRLVELARVLAGNFDVLLLDEPSSGLDGSETRQFGQILQTIVATRGCAILLVEHDMSLVLDICDSIYVLDYGRLLFQGTPDEVASNDLVRTAYLGAAEVPAELPSEPVSASTVASGSSR